MRRADMCVLDAAPGAARTATESRVHLHPARGSEAQTVAVGECSPRRKVEPGRKRATCPTRRRWQFRRPEVGADRARSSEAQTVAVGECSLQGKVEPGR